jgi:hypothetical protein
MIGTPVYITLQLFVCDATSVGSFNNDVTAVAFEASATSNAIATFALTDQVTPTIQNTPAIEPDPIATPKATTTSPTMPISNTGPESITQPIAQDAPTAAELATTTPAHVQVTAGSPASLALSATSRDSKNETGAMTSPTPTSVADAMGGSSASLSRQLLAKFRGILDLLSLS